MATRWAINPRARPRSPHDISKSMSGTDGLHRLQSLWMQHRRWLLPALVALMSIAAALKLQYQFRRLVWETGSNGAIDLVKYLHPWVAGWFSGQPVYQQYR